MNPNSILEFIVHPQFKGDPKILGRARMVIGMSLCLAVAAFVYAMIFYYLDKTNGAIILLIGGIAYIWILFHSRLTLSLNLLANEAVFVMCVSMTLLAMADGGVLAPNAMWLVIVPILAVLLVGVRGGIFWGAFSSLSVVAMMLVEFAGFEFPEQVIDSAMVKTVLQGLGTSGLIIVVTVFCLLFETTRLQIIGESEKAKDEIEKKGKELEDTNGKLFNFNNLRDTLIKQAANTTLQINSGARELSQSAQNLSNGVVQQAASLEEISSSMDEIESQTKINAKNSSHAQQISSKTEETAKFGNKKMEELLGTIKNINETSCNISKIIKVIDEIAFQTNLLALNAAVEAARAGKYGKGFTVVAEEVRNLAARSAEAAKNTTDLIESSTREVEKGVMGAEQTADIFSEIMKSISETDGLIKNIAISSQEQNSAIVEVSSGITQVNEVVQQNSAISEEMASASEQLTGQIGQLEQVMSQFKTQKETDTKTLQLPEVHGLSLPILNPL